MRLRDDRPNVMLDIETLSLKPNAHILSVAAVAFTADGPTETLRVDLGLSKQGRDISLDTLHWHLDLGTDLGRREDFRSAIVRLHAFLHARPKVRVWAKSPDFDCVILADAFRQLDLPVPWHYAHTRCVRTVCDGVEDLPTHASMVLQPHDPVADCLVQIAGVLKALT